MAETATDIAELRRTMVDCQLRTFDVTDKAVLARAVDVPREEFLPAHLKALAYSDKALTLGSGAQARRLLPPMILARLLQAARIDADDTVLTVGGGAGYGAALVAGLAKSVTALECDAAMSADAAACFARLDLRNARAITRSLAEGVPAEAPFDVIVIEGGIERRPSDLLLQLAPGGRLVAIERLSGGAAGRAVRFERTGGAVGRQGLFSFSAPALPGFVAEAAFAF